jgi:hypothetical protein
MAKASRTEGRPLQAAQEDLVLDELPRNTMGKVQKNILRASRRFFRQFASVPAGELVAIVTIVADGGTPYTCFTTA